MRKNFLSFGIVLALLVMLFVVATPAVQAKSVPSTNPSHTLAASVAHTENVPITNHHSAAIPAVLHNRPAALVVFCSLPHDVELYNNDGEWCIYGPNRIYFADVNMIVNTHGSPINFTDSTLSLCITLRTGQTMYLNGDTIVALGGF